MRNRNGMYCAMAILFISGACRAATLTVTSPVDSGAGTLRNTIAAAASGDTINFSTLITTVTTTSLITFSGKTLTIDGGATGIVLTTGGTSPLLSASGNPLTLAGLTIQQ